MKRKKKRTRDIPRLIYFSEAEYDRIQERMAEIGTTNTSAFIRKMALNGYVLNVDLAPVRDLVTLQRRCSNNLNQIAASVNTYGGIYPQEIKMLQNDYSALWNPLRELIAKLAEIVKL